MGFASGMERLRCAPGESGWGGSRSAFPGNQEDLEGKELRLRDPDASGDDESKAIQSGDIEVKTT